MVNKHWSFVSTCLMVILILCVGYSPTTADPICTSDNIKESTGVTVNVKRVSGGPKLSVKVVAKSPMKNIEIWAEPVGGNEHIGSWTFITGHKFLYCGIGASTIASDADLNLSQITYQWSPPIQTPLQVVPSQGTPSQMTPSQETSDQVTSNQETPSQMTPRQKTSSQMTPSQETPSQETPNGEIVVVEVASVTLTVNIVPTPLSINDKDERSLISEQVVGGSTPSNGSIIFKGILQFEDDPETYSFKSDVIPNETPNPTNPTNPTNPANSTNHNNGDNSYHVDNNYPKPSSATDSKFLFKGFYLVVLLVILVTL